MIDVENLICDLHHIAGTDSVDADIRRTACDAESAIASLRAWVNKLQMNVAEREAMEWFAEEFPGQGRGDARHAATLRGLLERLANEVGGRLVPLFATDFAAQAPDFASQPPDIAGSVTIRQPVTLTDAERAAVAWAEKWMPQSHPHAATLRGLLERLGGER